ncbi:helix-turn-helix domain-containing protein, partial [Streptomyces swartbergensis]
MDTQNPNVPSHAHAPVTGKKHPNRRHPRTGLVHDNARHTTRFTVIGNHLAQHPELSLLAIGLSVHIQSLPSGARVDIKSLAARFPEGTTRIAAALRELEAHGYLRRERERVPGGRIVTRTISCNQPGHSGTDTPRPAPRKRTRPPGSKLLPA